MATAAFAAQLTASTPAWSVNGTCRDGRPQGPYQLRGDDGRLRVSGAFNEGTRTGSFIFWRASGVREAHVPYDDRGLRNGTVATWYEGPPEREPPRHLESAWRHGTRDGETRSWYPNGHPRSMTEYDDGRIVEAAGWSERGAPLSERAARELALRDAHAADAEYAQRDTLVREHMPTCGR